MGALSKREIELVALGASIGSNCIPCVAYHVGEAKACGIEVEKIREAIDVAANVRSVPASLVRNTALAQLDGEVEVEPAAAGGCGCGDTIDETVV